MIITVVWYYILDAVICVATFFIVQKLYKTASHQLGENITDNYVKENQKMHREGISCFTDFLFPALCR